MKIGHDGAVKLLSVIVRCREMGIDMSFPVDMVPVRYLGSRGLMQASRPVLSGSRRWHAGPPRLEVPELILVPYLQHKKVVDVEPCQKEI